MTLCTLSFTVYTSLLCFCEIYLTLAESPQEVRRQVASYRKGSLQRGSERVERRGVTSSTQFQPRRTVFRSRLRPSRADVPVNGSSPLASLFGPNCREP